VEKKHLNGQRIQTIGWEKHANRPMLVLKEGGFSPVRDGVLRGTSEVVIQRMK
jgi:hypothetical protein